MALRAPGMCCFIPKSCSVRTWRGIIRDGAAQIGSLAVDVLFIAVRVGWGDGPLLGIEGKEGGIQGLRSVLPCLHVVDEIASYIAVGQKIMPFVVHFDMLFEEVYSRLDVAHQQSAVTALHAG